MSPEVVGSGGRPRHGCPNPRLLLRRRCRARGSPIRDDESSAAQPRADAGAPSHTQVAAGAAHATVVREPAPTPGADVLCALLEVTVPENPEDAVASADEREWAKRHLPAPLRELEPEDPWLVVRNAVEGLPLTVLQRQIGIAKDREVRERYQAALARMGRRLRGARAEGRG